MRELIIVDDMIYQPGSFTFVRVHWFEWLPELPSMPPSFMNTMRCVTVVQPSTFLLIDLHLYTGCSSRSPHIQIICWGIY